MCDALQKSSDNDSEHGPNKPGWYGEYIRMPFPLDSEVPQEYAKMLIDLAQQRTQGPLNIAKNQEDYQKPAVKKNRTKSPEVTYHPLPTARERNQQQQQQQQQQQPPSRATRRIGSFQR